MCCGTAHVKWPPMGREGKTLGDLASSVQKVRYTRSSLPYSFLNVLVQFSKDTATALTEAPAPSWGGISHAILQGCSE